MFSVRVKGQKENSSPLAAGTCFVLGLLWLNFGQVSPLTPMYWGKEGTFAELVHASPHLILLTSLGGGFYPHLTFEETEAQGH